MNSAKISSESCPFSKLTKNKDTCSSCSIGAQLMSKKKSRKIQQPSQGQPEQECLQASMQDRRKAQKSLRLFLCRARQGRGNMKEGFFGRVTVSACVCVCVCKLSRSSFLPGVWAFYGEGIWTRSQLALAIRRTRIPSPVLREHTTKAQIKARLQPTIIAAVGGFEVEVFRDIRKCHFHSSSLPTKQNIIPCCGEMSAKTSCIRHRLFLA